MKILVFWKKLTCIFFLIFSEDDGRWGVNIDTSGVTVFHECTVDPAVPDTLTHLVRSCSGKSTVSTCPLDYKKNDTVVELCSSYTAMVCRGCLKKSRLTNGRFTTISSHFLAIYNIAFTKMRFRWSF